MKGKSLENNGHRMSRPLYTYIYLSIKIYAGGNTLEATKVYI